MPAPAERVEEDKELETNITSKGADKAASSAERQLDIGRGQEPATTDAGQGEAVRAPKLVWDRPKGPSWERVPPVAGVLLVEPAGLE